MYKSAYGQKGASRSGEKEDEKGNKIPSHQLYERLKTSTESECHSLLKKHLTEERFRALVDRRTKFNGKLEDCIRSGL